MVKHISDNAISPGLPENGSAPKAPWHAPVLKRLDVDLTAGNKRNSNDPPTGANHFLNS
jgi:hypothetical protein